MRMKFWVCLWCAIAAACIIGGFVTRASITSLDPNSKTVLNSFYKQPELNNIKIFQSADYDGLTSGSNLVITCRFDGWREIQNFCYLSEVTVNSVIKGDKSLQGKKIKVYEPVWTKYSEAKCMKEHPIYNFNELAKKFGWQGESRILNSQAFAGPQYYTLMNKSSTYLLFLNPKKHFTEQEQIGLPNYIQTSGVYAKLTVSNLGAGDYQIPPDDLTVGDSMKYEILLSDPACIDAYFGNKKLILKKLNLQ